MTTLERVRAAIISAVPEIVQYAPVAVRVERPITLADVLRAIRETKKAITVDAHGCIRYRDTLGSWNLALHLDDQSPEVHEFLANMLHV